MRLLNKYFLLNSVFLLSFFPFIKFIPFINAEVQPFSALFATIYLIRFRKTVFAKSCVSWYLIIIIIYLCVALMKIIIYPYHEVVFFHVLESLLILLAPLIVFLSLFNNLTLVSVNCFRFAIYSWFFISVLQKYFPFILSATGIGSILSYTISRFSEQSLGGSRGVTGLSPEPSYGAYIIILLFLFSIFIYKINKINKKELRWMVFICIIMVFLNGSGSIYSLFIMFFLFYNFGYLYQAISTLSRSINSAQQIQKLILFLFFIIFSAILIYFLPTIFSKFLPQSRIADLISEVSSYQGQIIRLTDVLDITNNLGSQRTISVYVGYFNAVDTYGFGSGMGSWGTNFLDALEKAGLNPYEINFFINVGLRNVKPYSYGALVAFDMGFVGLSSLSIIFIVSIIKRLRINCKVDRYAWACLVLSMFILYFNTLASLQTGWLIFLIFLQDTKSLNSSSYSSKN